MSLCWLCVLCNFFHAMQSKFNLNHIFLNKNALEVVSCMSQLPSPNFQQCAPAIAHFLFPRSRFLVALAHILTYPRIRLFGADWGKKHVLCIHNLKGSCSRFRYRYLQAYNKNNLLICLYKNANQSNSKINWSFNVIGNLVV